MDSWTRKFEKTSQNLSPIKDVAVKLPENIARYGDFGSKPVFASETVLDGYRLHDQPDDSKAALGTAAGMILHDERDLLDEQGEEELERLAKLLEDGDDTNVQERYQEHLDNPQDFYRETLEQYLEEFSEQEDLHDYKPDSSDLKHIEGLPAYIKSIESFAISDRFNLVKSSQGGYDERPDDLFEDSLKAARGYVYALWAKDKVEREIIEENYEDKEEMQDIDGGFSEEEVENADWSGVKKGFEMRAEALEIEDKDSYSELGIEAWKKHKLDGEICYNEMARKQHIEIKALVGENAFSDGSRNGQSQNGIAHQWIAGVGEHDLTDQGIVHWLDALNSAYNYYQGIAEGSSKVSKEEKDEPDDLYNELLTKYEDAKKRIFAEP